MSPSTLFFSKFDVTRQAFYRSRLSFALVNLHPIVPGHVLVVPNRVVSRLKDLTGEEIADVFQTAEKVSRVIEREFGGESVTVACQDGPAAGQTVPHVHVHIIPRKFADFDGNNDEVYPAIEKSEAELEKSLSGRRTPAPMVDARAGTKPRTEEEMEKEATWLRSFFE